MQLVQARPRRGGGGGAMGATAHPFLKRKHFIIIIIIMVFIYLFIYLLVREVGDVRWVPLLCVRKIDPQNLRSEK